VGAYCSAWQALASPLWLDSVLRRRPASELIDRGPLPVEDAGMLVRFLAMLLDPSIEFALLEQEQAVDLVARKVLFLTRE